MLHDPEYDGLGRGEEERGQPGDDHHQPGAGVTLSIVGMLDIRAANEGLRSFRNHGEDS